MNLDSKMGFQNVRACVPKQPEPPLLGRQGRVVKAEYS